MTKLAFLAGASALVLSTAAFAADLPYRSQAPAYDAPPPVFTTVGWNGFYAGGTFGWRAANFDPVVNSFESEGKTRHSLAGAVHAGYNFQVSPSIVLGVEGDIGYGRNRASGPGAVGASSFTTPDTPQPGRDTITTVGSQSGSKAEIGWAGSVRGRIGYAFDRVMIYATGGLAFANLNLQGTSSTTVTQQVVAGQNVISTSTAFGPSYMTRSDKWTAGYTVGAGIEFAMTENILLRAEYLYADYGRHTVTVPSGATMAVDVDTHTARAGVSYKF
ncbi:outer membrane protein [Enterovirga rhinocerotis]|uniref:Outer membrane immunogenic protein n=1 Tax=Enterovirga rhinocerotis TaxID=1339210 RepID=A0A4R7BU47_9HYPH|nr:outer membrane protein [Enterovirga rhinocerotis]TDR89260.1 outer membrane immunogenic protein [Enterovirga rhinocerotis]